MFPSQRFTRRAFNTSSSALVSSAASAILLNASSSSSSSSSSATSKGMFQSTSTCLNRWSGISDKIDDDMNDTGKEENKNNDNDDDMVSFDFGEEDGNIPAAPVSSTTTASSTTMSSSASSAAAGSSSTSDAANTRNIKHMSTPTEPIRMRQAPPPKTVTLEDGTEEPASEYMTVPTSELVEFIRSYLTQRNIMLPDVEAKLFNALLAREEEFTCDQLLDILEKHFPPQTNERWGERVKLMIRDRCMKEAGGMSPLSVARAIVLVGLNGRARRDVEFFKKMCKILAHHINDIKDPHTLCYVLVALQNSRIKPPESFLALVGRRYPILNKKNPLYALPAYRALTFYSRAEYPMMNPYRYLADRIMAIARDNLRLEGKGEMFSGLGKKIHEGELGGPGKLRQQQQPTPTIDGEEIEEITALTDEDLDILKGLQREDKKKQPENTADAFGASSSQNQQQQQQPEQQQSFQSQGWGDATPTTATSSSWGQPPQQTSAEETTTTTTASSTTEETQQQEKTPEEQEQEQNSKSESEESIEEKLRLSVNAIPSPFQSSSPYSAQTETETENNSDNTTTNENEQSQTQTKSSSQQQTTTETKVVGGIRKILKPGTPEYLLAQFHRRTNGLSPVQFVRFLFVLASRRAPRQQYLRPIATDLLVPIIPILPPPTFMRLVISMRMFQSEDKSLIAAVIDRLVKQEGPSRVCLRNLFELLRLFGHQSVPIEVAKPHLLTFTKLCKNAFEDESRLRAKDMLAITGELRNIYIKLLASQEDGELLSSVSTLGSASDDWMEAVAETTKKQEETETETESESPSSTNMNNLDENKLSSTSETKTETEIEIDENEKEEKEEELNAKQEKDRQLLSAVEQMFTIVERFALRMNNLMDLGVLALTNAETLLEICKALPSSINESTKQALQQLKDARRHVDEEEGGVDAYSELLDIDIREIFFRIQIINNYDTFRSFRPLPATLVQDFKGMLDAMRCDYIVEAVHLYEQAFPGSLTVPVKRVLGRHILEKMAMELKVMAGGDIPTEPEPSRLTASGKIIEVEEARRVAATEAATKKHEARYGGEQQQQQQDPMFAQQQQQQQDPFQGRSFGAAAGKFRIQYVDDAVAAGVGISKKQYAPYDCMNPRYQQMLFNAKKFSKFVNMLAATPLKRVKNSEISWKYVEKKSEKLKMEADQHIVKVVGGRREEMEKMSLQQSEMAIRGQKVQEAT